MLVKGIALQACEAEGACAARVLSKKLAERNIKIEDGGYRLSFVYDEALEPDTFCLSATEEECTVSAVGRLGFLSGAGHLLRGAEFAEGGVRLSPKTESLTLHAQVRGMYLASHFHNYYHVASLKEITGYLEDLALLGVNWIMLCYPFIDLADAECEEARAELARHKKIITAAHGLGIRCCEILSANMGFLNYPERLGAKKNHDPLGRRADTGPTLCMALPESRELIDKVNRYLCEGLLDCGLDMAMTWPYDEGGCGCEQCTPWGASGFLRSSKRAFEIARSYFPEIKRCVSTWCFDTPEEGEWRALDASLRQEKWCDYILADSHTDFPAYPLEHDFGGVKLLNFPEISMWGLYPWGGWGATMLPDRICRLYQQTCGKISGGFPYSEGIYHDVNVAVVLQIYRDGQADAPSALRQYARYEFGLNDPEPFLELVRCIEKTHTSVAEIGFCDLADAERAFALAEEINRTLPAWGRECWRWRIIYLRAMIDARRYRIAAAKTKSGIKIGNEHGLTASEWEVWLKEDTKIRAGFGELVEIFHCRPKADCDSLHGRVRPVLDAVPEG